MGSSNKREKETVLQDLERYPLPEPSKPEWSKQDSPSSLLLSRLKKFYLWLVGIIAVILMLSYVFVTFPIADIIIGKVDSQVLVGNTLAGNTPETKDLHLEFEQSVLEQLQSYYLNNQQTEFSVCLGGMVVNKGYRITSLYFPTTYKRLFNQVTFEPCSADTLILLHSHPYKRCSASATDLRTLKKSQQENPSTLMLVMCESSRFAVYS